MYPAIDKWNVFREKYVVATVWNEAKLTRNSFVAYKQNLGSKIFAISGNDLATTVTAIESDKSDWICEFHS